MLEKHLQEARTETSRREAEMDQLKTQVAMFKAQLSHTHSPSTSSQATLDKVTSDKVTSDKVTSDKVMHHPVGF